METHELIDAEAFTKTLSGFDEIAIKRMFGDPLGRLEEGLIPRALLFVAERRGGMNDADSFRLVMNLSLGEIETRFRIPTQAVMGVGKATPTSGTSGGPTSSSEQG